MYFLNNKYSRPHPFRWRLAAGPEVYAADKQREPCRQGGNAAILGDPSGFGMGGSLPAAGYTASPPPPTAGGPECQSRPSWVARPIAKRG